MAWSKCEKTFFYSSALGLGGASVGTALTLILRAVANVEISLTAGISILSVFTGLGVLGGAKMAYDDIQRNVDTNEGLLISQNHRNIPQIK